MAPAPTFTVFTPTYNRAHTLLRVYDSLRVQSLRDFEWLIVDDGSSDGTADLVDQWQRIAPFAIRYIRQANRGKHIAFNRGVREAAGELFLPLDSDDGCTANALERFACHWRAIAAESRESFSGVTCLSVDQHGQLIGNEFPGPIVDSNSAEIVHRFKARGEKWGFHRTAVLRQFPFPEADGNRFIPEGLVWSRIARLYRTRFVNEKLRVYHQDPGADQRLSTVVDPSRHAAGLRKWHRQILNDELVWFGYAPHAFCCSAVHYVRFSLHHRVALRRQLGSVQPLARALCLLVLPLAAFRYLLDLRVKRRLNRPRSATSRCA